MSVRESAFVFILPCAPAAVKNFVLHVVRRMMKHYTTCPVIIGLQNTQAHMAVENLLQRCISSGPPHCRWAHGHVGSIVGNVTGVGMWKQISSVNPFEPYNKDLDHGFHLIH